MQHQGGGGSNMAAAGQGLGNWGLLAQYQGSYGPMYALGGYGGYGHAGERCLQRSAMMQICSSRSHIPTRHNGLACTQ
jgi:hypothetical protein